MIVKEDGTITQIKWEFRGKTYEIIASETTSRAHSVWNTIDTVKREDGKTQQFTRRQLRKYFNQ